MSVYRTIGPLVTFISRINEGLRGSAALVILPEISIDFGYLIMSSFKFHAQLS